MNNSIAVVGGIVLLLGSIAASAPMTSVVLFQADPWLGPTTKMQFDRQSLPDAPVQLDIPKRDWMLLPSSGSVVVALASRKGDAVVFVERSTLRVSLEPAAITDVFAEIETDAIKERYPQAAEFQSKVLEGGKRRLVAVQYRRQGVLGGERVRQYSIPAGKVLYRITCISSTGQFAAYDPVFAHIAASFTVTN